MALTEKQEEAVRIIVSRYKKREKYTVISGYAGSGKSYLIKYAIEALNLPDDQIAYIAYTGKAANVLAQKGCPNATTAHKLLYHAVPRPDGSFIFKPKLSLDVRVVVCDEISMLPLSMWELLMQHNVYVIAVGDPAQLPPVAKTEDNHVLDHPHVFLDQIVRQAQESEIIRLSMHIREGKPISNFISDKSQVQIINKSELCTGHYEWADQILCATNNTRESINQIMRQLKGYGELPTENDKVIALHNNWNLFSDKMSPLTNGTIGYITNFAKTTMELPTYFKREPLDILVAEVKSSVETEGIFKGLIMDYKLLTTGEKALNSKEEYFLRKNTSLADPPLEFVYAYAITTWKAQGSEWDKVLGFEEKFPFPKLEHLQFLYTMCTRAKERLVIVQN